MLAAEMVQAMDLATASVKGTKWLSTYCTTDMISNTDGGYQVQLVPDKPSCGAGERHAL